MDEKNKSQDKGKDKEKIRKHGKQGVDKKNFLSEVIEFILKIIE